ncbi:unnamed protein product [Sphagnum tenellum]
MSTPNSTVYLYPPVTGPLTISFEGRTYTGIVGSPLAVPAFDAAVLTANGWTTAISSSGGVNTYISKPEIMAGLGDSTVAWADNWGSFVNGKLSSPVGFSPNNRNLSAESFLNWVQFLTNQAIQMPDGYLYGASGMGSDVILAIGVPYILSLNPLPSICFVSCGTNDQFYNGTQNAAQPAASATPLTFAQTTSNLLSIYTQLTNAGIVVIGVPISPRSDISTITAAQVGTFMQVNEWMKKQVKTLSNFFIADPTAYLAAPSSTNFDSINSAVSGTGVTTVTASAITIPAVAQASSASGNQVYAYPAGSGNSSSPYNPSTYVVTRPDSLHTSALGGYFTAKSAVSVIRNILPSVVNNFNVNLSQNQGGYGNAYSNLLTNSTFSATGTASTTGFGGTLATGWTPASTDNTTALVWASMIQSANFPLQTLQRFQIGNSTTAAPTAVGTFNMANHMITNGVSGLGAGNTNVQANVLRFYQIVPSANLTPYAGSYVEATLYLEWPGNTIGNPANTIAWQGISGVGLQLRDINDSSGLYTCNGMFANFGPYPQEPFSGTILCRMKIYSTANGDPISTGGIRFTVFVYFDGRSTTMTGTNATEPVFADIRFGMPKLRLVF